MTDTKTLSATRYVTLPNGYDRRKHVEMKTFRIITLEEVKGWAVPVPEFCTYCQSTGKRTLDHGPNDGLQTEPLIIDCGACNGTGTRLVDKTPSHVWFHMPDGKARQVKVNGRVKTWKRDPNRIEVSIKYGLYEHARLTSADIENGVLLAQVSEDNA